MLRRWMFWRTKRRVGVKKSPPRTPYWPKSRLKSTQSGFWARKIGRFGCWASTTKSWIRPRRASRSCAFWRARRTRLWFWPWRSIRTSGLKNWSRAPKSESTTSNPTSRATSLPRRKTPTWSSSKSTSPSTNKPPSSSRTKTETHGQYTIIFVAMRWWCWIRFDFASIRRIRHIFSIEILSIWCKCIIFQKCVLSRFASAKCPKSDHRFNQ